MTYLITLLVAFCSIVYELLMAQTLSVLMGDTVLRYSMTIGVYLASLGIGSILCKKQETPNADRLIRIELYLSGIGGTSVILLCMLDVLYRYLGGGHTFFSQGIGAHALPAIFFVLSHAVIVAIGVLSGFEIPLLIALRAQEKPDRANVVLGVDYFGSLVGAVLFALVLLPRLGVFAVAAVIALVNAVACALLLVFKRAERKARYAKILAAVAFGLLVLLAFSPNSRQFFLKKFYYYQDVTSLGSVLDSFEQHPTVEVYRSRYQRVHLVQAATTEFHDAVHRAYSTKLNSDPEFPRGWWLFLNRQFQFFSDTEEFWHEFFVHVPIQWTAPPAKVLVLGGGDGLVAKQLLKYDQVQSITEVDIDPRMLHLSRHHPLLRRLNRDSFRDPRVRLVCEDAFMWLQDCEEEFDAVYIDFPNPDTYDLSKLYSVEFYSMVRHCLADGGYAAADIPGAKYGLWETYYSTLRAAAFRYVRPYENRLDLDNPALASAQRWFADNTTVVSMSEEGYPLASDNPALVGQVFDNRLAELVEGLSESFVFLQEEKGELNTSFTDYGIPLFVLNAKRLELASDIEFDTPFTPERVNSIFRPTIPRLALFPSFVPY